MKLQLLSLQVSKHLQCFRLFLLTLLLCGYMQTKAETWTDDKGFTWSFTVSGTEATDIKPAMFDKKVYIYGDPNRSEEEKAEDPQLPFTPGAWDAASMRFSSTEGTHLPTIPDDVYFSLKTLIFDVSDVSSDFDLKIMNGWWSNTYYDHVKWEDGLNEVPITQTMANECAKGGLGRDLDLMLTSGSMTLNAVYYQTISVLKPEVVIPAKVYVGSTELTVTSIGAGAFSGCSGLTSVTIPEGVISIGGGAFLGCSGLTSVTIPESVTNIGDWAFCGCSGLTSVTIPEGVINIGGGAFSGCSGLTSVTIPEGVTSIGNDAFSGCSGLTSVTIPESVTNIGSWAFYGCSNLTSIIIPKSVTNIGDGAFRDCSGLTSVTIPESVTNIGSWAFSYCSGLTSVTIPESVTNIGDWAFLGCSGLTSVTIPEGVTSIGNHAFSGCSGLTSVTIPEGVTSIGNDAFSSCSGLTSVTIPEGVTSIGNYAFYECYRLTSVTIPEGVTSIGNDAFCACSGLTNVTIPESVTSIGNYAFRACSGLTSISVESGNPVYDSRNNCNALIETATNTLIAGCNNTIIPKSVTNIGSWAFSYCSGLTSVTIPEGVTSIGNDAFFDCSGLTSVTIPEGVTSIGNDAFCGCSGLTSVTIPEGVTSIGPWAFYASGLATVTSLIKDPFEIDSNVFSNWDTSIGEEITSATLYVPAGTKEKYEATSGWNVFKNIVEMGLLPVDEGETIDIGNEINEETNLDGTVVDNVFVNISNGDGGFDPVEGCLIVSKPTDDSAINGKDIFGDDFKDNYTGIVFKVNEGKGSIKVEAETQGNMVLKVKIGNSEPIEMELDGKLKVKFPYNVSEETLVYIYGGMSTAGAKATLGTRASSDADLLKIYGFEIVSDASGIEATESGLPANADAPVYNLNGQRVDTPTKGIYIKNGRKVLVK